MTKEALRQKIIDIFCMDKSDLEKFERDLSFSSVDSKARGFLVRAIKIVRDIDDSDSFSLEAVSSDIDNDFGTEYK